VRFLGDVDDVVRATREPEVTVHLEMDNYATHKTPRVKRWLLQHPRDHVQFMPTIASWPNLVERIFSHLTTTQLLRGVNRSVWGLEAAISEYR